MPRGGKQCVEEWTKALKFAQILNRMSKQMTQMSKQITEEGKKAAKSAQILNQMSERITHMSREVAWLHCYTLCFEVLEIIVDPPSPDALISKFWTIFFQHGIIPKLLIMLYNLTLLCFILFLFYFVAVPHSSQIISLQKMRVCKLSYNVEVNNSFY